MLGQDAKTITWVRCYDCNGSGIDSMKTISTMVHDDEGKHPHVKMYACGTCSGKGTIAQVFFSSTDFCFVPPPCT